MVEIVVAPESQREEVWKLFQEYCQELSLYDGEKRPRTSHHYSCFDAYWQETTHTPFLILLDHEPIGFCLLQDTGVVYRIEEFYIRPLHRRRGFGKIAVDYIRNHCRNLGRHKTLAANIYMNNEPAIRFWQSAGFKDTGRRMRLRETRLMETEMELSKEAD